MSCASGRGSKMSLGPLGFILILWCSGFYVASPGSELAPEVRQAEFDHFDQKRRRTRVVAFPCGISARFKLTLVIY